MKVEPQTKPAKGAIKSSEAVESDDIFAESWICCHPNIRGLNFCVKEMRFLSVSNLADLVLHEWGK